MFIAELTAGHTVAEMFHQGQRRHLAMTPMQSATQVAKDPQLEARSYFCDVSDSSGATRRYPGAPYRHERTPARVRRAAPRVGEHESGVWGGGGRSVEVASRVRESRVSSSAKESGGAGPLSGLRVLEFCMGMAGPWIGRAMAFCGAEVIKVESKKHPDVTRQYVPPWAPELGVQSRLSPWFTDWNAGKRFVGLDLARPESVALARDLAGRSDVVIENFAPGVLEKLGLGWSELRTRKPDLVFLGTSGFGDDGPYRPYVTWGPNIEAVSGLAVSSGFAHRPCAMTHYAYPDAVAALHGLFAILCALEHRDRSGEGQRVYLSQCEAVIASFGDVMMECLHTGKDPARMGNRAANAAPHGCYPCRGDDRWCAIAVARESEWKALCVVAGNPPWASEERFSDLQGRLRHAEDLDAQIAAWTRDLDAYDLESALQGAGVAAGVVQTTEDQFRRDEQFRARGFFEEIQHELKGPVFANGIPFGLTGTPGRSQHAGAALGKDNAYAFREVLGLSADEFSRLQECGAIEESDETPPRLPPGRGSSRSLRN